MVPWGTSLYKNSLLILVLLFLMLGVFLSGIFHICDFDIWYHLASGRYILQSGHIPSQDIFSYTAQNKPWVDASWLSQVIFYGVYFLGGINGLIIFKAIILVLAFWFVFLAMRRRNALFTVSVLIILLSVVVSRERFMERPHIFSLFFLSLYGYILGDRSFRHSKLVWILLPLQVLWANLHSESLLGIGLVFIYLASEIIRVIHAKIFLPGKPGERKIDLPWELGRIRFLFVLFVAMVFLSLINPFTYKSLFYGVFTLKEGIFRRYIEEFRPVDFAGGFSLFWLFFSLGLASFFLHPKSRLEDKLIFIIFSSLAISVVRFHPEFALLASPIVAGNLSHSLGRFFQPQDIQAWQEGSWQKLMNLILVIIILAVALGFIFGRGEGLRFGLGVNENILPKKGVEFIKKENLQGKMFNTMAFGGYLIWHLYPERKVFIDGRTDVYGPELLFKEVKFGKEEVWKELMARFNFDYALISNLDFLRLYPCRNLDAQTDWALVFWDDTSLIYVNKKGKNAKAAEKFAYKYVRPNNPDLSYLDAYLRAPEDRRELIAEFRRNLKENPRCLLAETSLAYIYDRENEHDQAIAYLKEAIEIAPYKSELYGRLGLAYQKKGMLDLAMEQYKKALKIDSRDFSACVNLGGIYFLRQEYKRALYQYRRALEIDPTNEGVRQNALLALEAIVKSSGDASGDVP